jgi:hypothetical protein
MVTDQGLRALEHLRSSAACALTLLLASAGCTPSLELGDYEFHRSGIAGDTFDVGGAGGETGSGGDSTAGGGDSGAAGNGGDGPLDSDAGWTEDAGADSGEPGGGNGGGGTCPLSELCVPTIPVGWTGPIAVSSLSGASSCPGTYASSQGSVNSGLQASAASCGCGCGLNTVSCYLEAQTTGDEFTPTEVCDLPPDDSECLAARPAVTCDALPSQNILAASWQTTRLTCGGASPTTTCGGGTCYPNAGSFGQTCISQSGDVSCPSSFPNRTLYFRSFSDNRSCSACNCFPVGQECQIQMEICATGFFDVTVSSNDDPYCLNSGEDGGVNVDFSVVLAQGTCSTTGGAAQGSAVPTNPVTICCL